MDFSLKDTIYTFIFIMIPMIIPHALAFGFITTVFIVVFNRLSGKELFMKRKRNLLILSVILSSIPTLMLFAYGDTDIREVVLFLMNISFFSFIFQIIPSLILRPGQEPITWLKKPNPQDTPNVDARNTPTPNTESIPNPQYTPNVDARNTPTPNTD